jgi:hypothetical protein
MIRQDTGQRIGGRTGGERRYQFDSLIGPWTGLRAGHIRGDNEERRDDNSQRAHIHAVAPLPLEDQQWTPNERAVAALTNRQASRADERIMRRSQRTT